jgi:hypothetical protein
MKLKMFPVSDGFWTQPILVSCQGQPVMYLTQLAAVEKLRDWVEPCGKVRVYPLALWKPISWGI